MKDFFRIFWCSFWHGLQPLEEQYRHTGRASVTQYCKCQICGGERILFTPLPVAGDYPNQIHAGQGKAE